MPSSDKPSPNMPTTVRAGAPRRQLVALICACPASIDWGRLPSARPTHLRNVSGLSITELASDRRARHRLFRLPGGPAARRPGGEVWLGCKRRRSSTPLVAVGSPPEVPAPRRRTVGP